jgi:MGT family glycosyltransferase
MPENIAIYGWVPQVEVLKHGSLFISHGGMNSAHDSLYLSVPLRLVPQQAELTMNATRVSELGTGLMLKKAQAVLTIRENAAQLLTDAHFNVEAKCIGDSFRAAGGMVRTANETAILLRKHTGNMHCFYGSKYEYLCYN